MRRLSPSTRAMLRFASVVVLAVGAGVSCVQRFGAGDTGYGLPSVAALLVLPAAWVLGRVLLLVELLLVSGAKRVRPSSVPADFEGFLPASPLFKILTDRRFLAVAVVAEEAFWRAGLISVLTLDVGFSPARAIVISGVCFGLRHLHFGGGSGVLKIMHGLAWGVLFVLTGSILPPLVSHLTYDYFVWRRMRRTRSGSFVSSEREVVDAPQA